MDNKKVKIWIKTGLEILSGLILLFANFLISVEINIFKSKHLKDDNALRKIINKNNVKISYPCTNNISKRIDNHNKKLINKLDWNSYDINDSLKHACNCKIKNECPLGNKCNLDNIIYQANISAKKNDNDDKAYIGMTSLKWKFKYYHHLQSFRNPSLKIQLPDLGITGI